MFRRIITKELQKFKFRKEYDDKQIYKELHSQVQKCNDRIDNSINCGCVVMLTYSFVQIIKLTF